jgi:hypothetical protein
MAFIIALAVCTGIGSVTRGLVLPEVTHVIACRVNPDAHRNRVIPTDTYDSSAQRVECDGSSLSAMAIPLTHVPQRNIPVENHLMTLASCKSHHHLIAFILQVMALQIVVQFVAG